GDENSSSSDSGCETDEAAGSIDIYTDEDIDDVSPVLVSYKSQSNSLESIPIVVGTQIIRAGNFKTNNRSADDDKQLKTTLNISFDGLEMVAVLDEREYGDNVIQCGFCSFNSPIPSKGCGAFIDRVVAMMDVDHHCKIKHPLAYCASKASKQGSLPKPQPKGKVNKEMSKMIRPPVKSGRPRGRPPKSKKDDENRKILPSPISRCSEQRRPDGEKKATFSRLANDDAKKSTNPISYGGFGVSIEEKVKLFGRRKI
ncbi:hypothetical protein Ocin01_10269, partial [Orchesella cincta]